MIRALLLISFALAVFADYTPDALADQISNLPGAEKLNIKFNQFSGYLSVPGNDPNTPKQLHYWFVESEHNAATDPVAFWTNGGPGCSGLIGFLTEQGPFKPNEDMSLSLNEYAWNKIANMVFIESPASVGFSYSNNKADYTTGDAQTAIDNYNLIQAFFNRFPQYRTNDLYISSESYGGHYMPTLAKQIVDENKNSANPKLNFKGFAVGNPYTDVYSGTPASIDTYWGHQLVPLPTYQSYVDNCRDSKKPNVRQCTKLATQLLNSIGNLNPYALDYPVCLTNSASKNGRAQRLWQLHHQLQQFGIDFKELTNFAATEEYEPCESNYALAYLNQQSVKEALHVDTGIKWTECSYKLKYNSSDGDVSTAPIYNYLIDGGYGLNILVYSGDDDSVCATIGTQKWIWNLGYEAAANPWSVYTVNGQTAGYITAWKNTKLGLVTIHGAGHEVPTYKPEVALDLWKKYLAGEFTSA